MSKTLTVYSHEGTRAFVTFTCPRRGTRKLTVYKLIDWCIGKPETSGTYTLVASGFATMQAAITEAEFLVEDG